MTQREILATYDESISSYATVLGDKFILQLSILLVLSLGHEGGRGRGLVTPVWWKHLLPLVVSDQSVDSALDENESELGVFVLAVTLEMLADTDSTLDQVVQIVWVLG